jgi:SNF2 family DNA or RNA helicase
MQWSWKLKGRIQIASLIGYLGSQEHKIYPFLVVVPNSTITNWVREFEKWVPHMRVVSFFAHSSGLSWWQVPYYGLSSCTSTNPRRDLGSWCIARKVISKYELYRKGLQGKAAGLKAYGLPTSPLTVSHVILTTYDVITGGDFSIFRNIPRWEMLVVDEGQRRKLSYSSLNKADNVVKSDSNLIFNRLKTLNTVHRILLTGTPLNNNLRELFNLLNFLDPINFKYVLLVR